MPQPEFNFTGAQLSEAGQSLALDHAEAVNPGWAEMAYQHLVNYVGCYGSTQFTSESFRDYAELMGLPNPPSKRAFGGLFSKAKRAGLIRSVGLTKTMKPSAHNCFASLWIKA